MRFATIRTPEGTTAARLDGDLLIPLAAADVGELLAAQHETGAVVPERPGTTRYRPAWPAMPRWCRGPPRSSASG